MSAKQAQKATWKAVDTTKGMSFEAAKQGNAAKAGGRRLKSMPELFKLSECESLSFWCMKNLMGRLKKQIIHKHGSVWSKLSEKIKRKI